MRKIIITVIATIVLVASVEKAKGQWESQTVITSADFPTVNVLTGVNAKISFGIWRFEPFLQVGQYFQLFEERMTMEGMLGWDGTEYFRRDEFHSPRFQDVLEMNVGVKFRVTDRNSIILGLRGTDNSIIGYREGRMSWEFYYLGYIRRENLSQRTNIELSLFFTPRRSLIAHYLGGFYGGGYMGAFSIGSWCNAIAVSSQLNFEIAHNLKLNMQLRYTRLFNLRLIRSDVVNLSEERLLTRNLIDFSIGIHYHIGRRQQQQAQQRQPRQQVSPRHRALPCPPGQMRHNRSWDRPSSVFNHPSGR